MEQGKFACSTPVLARQGDLPDQIGASDLNKAVASLLTRPGPSAWPTNDHELLRLGAQFDAAHDRWRNAVEANREPSARHSAFLATAELSGALTMEDHKAAEDLPGVREAGHAEDEAFSVVAELALQALRMPAHSVAELAVQARSLIPNVWPTGSYEEEAALSDDEDIDREAVRLMISSCCALAGVDWRGRPVSGSLRTCDPVSESLWAALRHHCDRKGAFEAAATAADRVVARKEGRDDSAAALAPAEARSLAASLAHDQAYRDLLAVRPQTPGELLVMLRHLAEHEADHRGIEDEPDHYGALIGAVEGMRFASFMPSARYDLSRLSIRQLKTLADVAYRKAEDFAEIDSQAISWLDGRQHKNVLGEIIGKEEERMGFLRDYAVAEIERRRPLNKTDADLRLAALTYHHLFDHGYIEPKLLSELVAAWGAR